MLNNEVERSMSIAKDWGMFAVNKLRDEIWPGGVVMQHEKISNPISKKLDVCCGIDYTIEHNGLLYGLSVRVQSAKFAQNNTFTVRTDRKGADYCVPSELFKTIMAVKKGAITAAYHYHAYVDCNADDWPNVKPTKLLSYGLVKRIPFFRWVWDNRFELLFNETEDKKRIQTQQFKCIPYSQVPQEYIVAAKEMQRIAA